MISKSWTALPSLKLAFSRKWGPPGKGDSYWKPSFLWAMLALGSVMETIKQVQLQLLIDGFDDLLSHLF